jgi:hypothetical protein
MEFLKGPINVATHITGVCAKGEVGRVAPKGVSYSGEKCKGKWDREVLRGFEFNEDGHLMSKVRILDRKEDYYKELVINTDTGNIDRDVEQPLSEHTGRGSAKSRRVDQA